MVGSVVPVGADAPHVAAEDQYRHQEKHSHNFEPKGVAHAGEGAQKTGDAAGETAAGVARHLAGSAAGNRLR